MNECNAIVIQSATFSYMSVVLQDTDDLVKEVEVFTDGSFHAVQPPTPAMQEIVDDEHLCIPASNTAPIVKTEVVCDSLHVPSSHPWLR